jgi:hypothetical protein
MFSSPRGAASRQSVLAAQLAAVHINSMNVLSGGDMISFPDTYVVDDLCDTGPMATQKATELLNAGGVVGGRRILRHHRSR